MQRFVLTLATALGLTYLVAAQTTPSGPVTSPVRSPVVTSYPINGGMWLAANGTSGAPSYSFVNDPTIGLYRVGSAQLGIQASGGINFGTSATNNWIIASTGELVNGTANTYDIGRITSLQPRNVYVIGRAPTVGTDSTAVNNGEVTRLRQQTSITPATGGAGNCGTAFLAGALTADCTIATLPAGMKLTAIYADVTVGFTCSGTCTGTKVVQCGTAAGGTQILAAGLNVATTGQFGLADADLGSGMTRAAAIQGGLIGSWSSTTPVSCRFTSGTGNWGSGAATFVNAGAVTFTLISEQIK